MTLVTRMTRPMVILLAALLAGRVAYAQEVEAAMSADYGEPAGADQAGPPPPIPPYVEGPAVQARGGGYCFEGPHPVDSTVEPGVTWDNTAGRHVHGYPPFDLRLFNQQDGCYYFIGDPSDFGYAGETYSYYGAHPILASYGGGWCFMIGPHHHFWRPWSPMFVTVGPWFYWEGPYDPFFWTYWPYYHYYYRAHYPVHYSHGAFFRSHVVAPRIPVVPRPPRFGTSWNAGYRGSAMPGRPGGSGPGAMPARPGMAGPGAMPPRPGTAAPGAMPARPGMAAPGAMPPRPGTTAPGAMPARPGMPAPGAMPARPGMPAPGAMPARPMVPMQRGAAPGGSFAPHGYSAPAPRGGGFSAPAPRGGGFSAPAPHVGGGHFGGGFRGGRR